MNGIPKILELAPKAYILIAAVWLVVNVVNSVMLTDLNIGTGAFGMPGYFYGILVNEIGSHILNALLLVGVAMIIQLLIMILRNAGSSNA